MSHLSKDLVFVILQFLEEEGFKDAARMLERQCGFYFEMEYFVEMILSGEWEEAEKYLSGFTEFYDNKYSTKIYFEMRKQKFLEKLVKGDRAAALDILLKDLKVFQEYNEEVFKEMTELLTLKDIRDHPALSTYGDSQSARTLVALELRKIIKANPLFRNKMEFPSMKEHRLRTLINQSLNWQHALCKTPWPNPVISTLFFDHVCSSLLSETTSTMVPTCSSSSQSTPSAESNLTCLSIDLSLGQKDLATTTGCVEDTVVSPQSQPFDSSDAEISTIHTGPNTMDIPDCLQTAMHPDQTLCTLPRSPTILPRPSTPPNPSEKNELEICGSISNAGLHMVIVGILKAGSAPTCMDFHPVQLTSLLVGTVMGDIELWDVSSREKLLSRNFKVWEIEKCSMKFKAALLKDPHVSVNSIAWSPDGLLLGVAFSQHIVQIYRCHVGNNVQQKLEIDAHVGGVNDIAFSVPEKQLLVLTCGDDRMVKAWNVTTGVRMYSFEGHKAPVHSLCPYSKSNIDYFFSISEDGNIKAWLYDNLGARVDYEAPGQGCTSMAYNGGDRRLFSCGTNKSGESFLVEWDETEGSIKRTYQGLQKNSLAVVHFDILKNQFLAAGDEHLIKIWHMDKVELLTTIDAGGDLPANPRIQFSKDTKLLAVFANENRIKILATDSGPELLPTSDTGSVDASGVLSDTFRKNKGAENSEVLESEFIRQASVLKNSKPLVSRPSHFQALLLPSHEEVKKISRLMYNHSGNAIVALASNSVHLLWKWARNDLNLSGKATTDASPQLCQPKKLMTNDLSPANSEEAVPCFALSNNDSYLLSASGGKISLFNLMTCKTMLTMMPSPPATTCLAFYPLDNNIVAVGRDDSSIVIYNVRLAKVISKLDGHSKRVSGLAFSSALNVLVSAGADSQISVWDTQVWGKLETCFLKIPDAKKSATVSNTYIQFDQDQTHILAVQETLLAIYKARNLECIKQWIAEDFPPITAATFSCDSQMVYASFMDGTVSIFDPFDLEPRCLIIPAAYLPSDSSYGVYPLDIAAHPKKPNQFTIGLSDGRVFVLEPTNPDGRWNMFHVDENGFVGKMRDLPCF